MKPWQRTIALTIIVLILATIAYALYATTGGKSGGAGEGIECDSITIYTYESLLQWGDNPEAVWDAVFGAFERDTGIKVNVVNFSDAGTALNRALLDIQTGQEPPDIIIGLDNILVHKAKEKGVLEKYTPSNIDQINPELIQALDPEGYAIPYDYGLIALVYDSTKIPDNLMSNLTFQDLLTRTVLINGEEKRLVDLLVTENPQTSSTGLSFLLWQIAVYQHYELGDWTQWWRQGHPRVVESWGDAYSLFPDPYPIVVSYGTDPAYSYHFYNDTKYKAALVWYNGKQVAWLQVEGIALLKDAPHKECAKRFIDWFLSPSVQKYIPLNNWMYPANTQVQLPKDYQYAINPSQVELANQYLTTEEVATNVDNWIDTWLAAVGGQG
ncbi:MAG: thiamine ABC transporter substrate-binding protein [Desulfurococcales archaeon]|nr:thiamine ABC transporter substrate-binding protein [Desulfurococcales archaeon]